MTPDPPLAADHHARQSELAERVGPSSHAAETRLQRLATNRVVHGIGANGIALVATLIVQLASVPIFLSTVGVNRYGAWLLLTALPSYLSLSDLGFAAASATAATQRVVAGQDDEARAVICSAWWFVTRSAFVLLLTIGAIGTILLHGKAFSGLHSQAVAILWLQLVWVFTWMQVGFCEAAYRSSGQYPRGIAYLTVLRLAEFGGMAVALLSLRSLVAAAAALLLVRVVGSVMIYVTTRRRLVWFSLAPRWAVRSYTRALVAPSLTYAGFTVSYAVLNQGLLILVGIRLDHLDVVRLATVRTMTNLLLQVTATVSGGSLAELTRAMAAQEVDRARRIQSNAYRMSAALSVLGGLLICIAGPFVIHVWTHDRVHASRLFITLMVLTTVADAPWQVTANALRAVNAHRETGIAFLVGCAGSMSLCWLTVPYGGLTAIPLSLFFTDVVVTPVAVWHVRKLELL